MAPRTSTRRSQPDRMEYGFWLVFGRDGSMRFSRLQPGTDRNERAMACMATLPMILFATPELKATIEVASPAAAADFKIDAKAAAEALTGVIGCDVDLIINPAKGE